MSCKCGASVVVYDGDPMCSNCWLALSEKRFKAARKRKRSLVHVDARIIAIEEETERRRQTWRAA